MANNDFNSFSDMDDSSFGDSFGSDDFGSGSTNSTSSFDDDFSFEDTESSDLNINSGNNDSDLDFEGQFNSTPSTSEDTSKSGGSLKKAGIITAIVGIVIVIAFIIIAGLISKKNNTSMKDESSVTIVEETHERTDINVDNIISSSDETQQYIQQNTQKTSNNKDNDWTEITDEEQITFNETYTNLIFTVTEINHYARLTDNNLVVTTTLKGSLSGMSGTYEIEVPYNKGILLSIGNEFSVNVLLGSFNGKTVIGDVKY